MSDSSNFRNKLNPSQAEAVSAIEGPVLVIAGAGSGKTKTIEYRVLNLVENKIDPRSILLLTFTRKAAHEMLSRASSHDPRCKYVEGGTFHSFAFKMLKIYSKALGLSNQFLILDEGDSGEAIGKCAARLGLFDEEKRFPKKNTLKDIISMSINKNTTISDIIEREYPHFIEFAGLIEKLRIEYAKYKVGKNYLDYDDLLIYLKMLLEIDEIRLKLSNRYAFIMVDEYQDTNFAQGEITYLLAKEHKNIMVVGDDAQSIYGFRGSSHKNIMEFPKKFHGCRIIKLEENYRSTQGILNVANAVLENMADKYSKCLFSKKESGIQPKLNFFKNQYDEAAFIVKKILSNLKDGIELKDQAVLFRAAYVSIPLQAELARNNIPFQVFGGLKFYETAHVKDLISHLKIIVNPLDEISWDRILMLIEGIGPKTADKISQEILLKTALGDIIKGVLGNYQRTGKFQKPFGRIATFLKESLSCDLNPSRLYELAYEYYLPIMKEKFDDWHVRLNDLKALSEISTRYDSLEVFLADFAIEPPERGVWKVEPRQKEAEDILTLSTIHSAKGLEWDTVFLMGLIEGVLPSSFALGRADEIEEESRLFYVALTRAKNNLQLLVSHEGIKNGISQFNKVSRFLDKANILSKLTSQVIFEKDCQDDIDLEADSGEVIKPAYDKNSFLEKLIDYFE